MNAIIKTTTLAQQLADFAWEELGFAGQIVTDYDLQFDVANFIDTASDEHELVTGIAVDFSTIFAARALLQDRADAELERHEQEDTSMMPGAVQPPVDIYGRYVRRLRIPTGAKQMSIQIMEGVQAPFGLTISSNSAKQIALSAVHLTPVHGVRLVVTPNIDHIATIRRSPPLARAYRNATLVVCDGWPVQAYLRWCGHRVDRVTGCEITSELMRLAPFEEPHRLFFVVDSVETQKAVDEWAAQYGVVAEIAVPPLSFERDAAYSTWLAGMINRHRTTLLIMAVGAPRSEIFVDSYRSFLPPCWAFCVGQAVRVKLGLVKRAPGWMQAIGMEWLWRVLQEPSRLTMRYASATVGFGLAVFQDQLRQLSAQ